jgi:tetratricopeptide (TPR) repeat protein
MTTTRHILSVAAIAVALSSAGCQSAKRLLERVSPAASSSTKPVDPGRPATEAEAAAFAVELERAVAENAGLARLVDTDAIIARGFADLELPANAARTAADAMAKSFGQTLALGLKGGGSYKLLKNEINTGERRVRFRLLGGDGAFNYHDYVVVVRKGATRAVDIHMLTTGEPLSTTLRRSLLPLAAESKKGVIERLTSKESTYLQHLSGITKMSQFQTDPKGALAAYATLPDVLKTEKNLLMLRVQASAQVNDQEYLAAMEDYRKAFPNDPSMRVMSIDYFYMKKLYKEAIEQVAALEAASGPDAHLNTLRGRIQAELGNLDDARAELSKALALEPDLPEAVTFAILLDLATHDEAGAIDKIRGARRHNVDLAGIAQDERYVALLAKPGVQKKLDAPEASPAASSPR